MPKLPQVRGAELVSGYYQVRDTKIPLDRRHFPTDNQEERVSGTIPIHFGKGTV
jgi:hypothetical protein